MLSSAGTLGGLLCFLVLLGDLWRRWGGGEVPGLSTSVFNMQLVVGKLSLLESIQPTCNAETVSWSCARVAELCHTQQSGLSAAVIYESNYRLTQSSPVRLG